MKSSEYNSTLVPAVLIQVHSFGLPIYNKNETLGLAKSAGYEIFSYVIQDLDVLNVKTFLGKGKVSQIRESLQNHFKDSSKGIWKEMNLYQEFQEDSLIESVPEIDLKLPSNIAKPEDLTFIFNNRLNHSQMMNLQGIWGTKVLDRDDLILEIFEKHAKTKQSKLQIQRARVALEAKIVKREYGLHLQEKQGRGFMGKGLSGWEPQKRAFRRRTRKIDLELEQISHRRALQRKGRKNFYNVGILGYTNAGKSTFLNKLAHSDLETADEEFTTVMPRTRKVTFPKFDEYGNWCGENILFTDSVGFISDMSGLLFDAFLSTLEELIFSDLLVVILDIAEPDFSRIILKLETSNQSNSSE